MYFLLYCLMYPFFKIGCRFKVEGRENIPEGNFLFISNHTYYKDVPLLAIALKGRTLRFLAKKRAYASFYLQSDF